VSSRCRSRGPAPAFAAALALVAATLATAAAPARAATPCPASVSAPSAIVIEVSTGVVACERAADRERPIASTTKLMTALLTLEKAKLSDVYTAARYFPPAIESQIGLQQGERMTVRDLLRGLLVESANDAAVTLAQGVAGTPRAFVRAMNRRAAELGLEHTHYANPIGLDESGNYSSARDLVRLATVLRTSRFFRKTVDESTVTLRSGLRPRAFENRNDLVRQYPWVNGVKSGHTRAAGYVLVGSGRRPGKAIQLVSAILGTPSVGARDADTVSLLRWGFTRFQRIRALQRGDVLASVPIRFRRGAELELEAARGVRRVVPRGRRDEVTVRAVGVPAEVTGPIRRGQRLGTAEVLQRGKRVETVPLVAVAGVPAAGLAQRTKSWFTGPLAIVLAFAVLAGTVLLARQLRRGPRPRRRGGEEARVA
jgi:D-alanyl-D-alanine carboxypeptidase (penicillin-binding protein 5/6)